MRNFIRRHAGRLALAVLIGIPLTAYAANFVNVNASGNATVAGNVSAGGSLGADGGIAVVNGASFDTLLVTTTKNKGTCILGTSCSAITVLAGAVCSCADTTGVHACSAVVSSTTLAITGNSTDTIAYICE